MKKVFFFLLTTLISIFGNRQNHQLEFDKYFKENGNKLRDILAFEVGSNTIDLKKIKYCKKLISNPILKKELGFHEKNI